jgi:hypothetical protein
MAGLVPAIHVFGLVGLSDVDARHKAGHDVPTKTIMLYNSLHKKVP